MLRGNLVEAMLLAGILASSIAILPARAQSTPQAQKSGPAHSPYKPSRFTRRAEMFYTGIWGVDSLDVKAVESGEMIRFSYRVLDVNKAKTLNDKKYHPFLIDEKAHVKLVVPQMEKVGQLRQSSPPEAGRVYWMLFSNKGRPVKRGDHVRIVIGNFRADELVVD